MGRHKRQSSYLHKQEEWKELYESGLSFTQIAKREGIVYSTVQNVLKGVVVPRPKKKFAHLAEKWVELYNIYELSTSVIAEQYNTDAKTVSNYLKAEGVRLRREYGQASPFEKFIPEWIEAYKSGKSLKEIADEYGTYPQTVHRNIEDKVEMREYTETSQVYTLKEPEYLKTIDSHEKAYWLGIWYGTGFISKSVNGFEATLNASIKDVITLERFKETIGYEKPLEEYQEKEIHVKRLRIHSKSLYETLFSHGLKGNKIDTLSFPETLSPEFYNSFILGYYEGKGSSYVSSGIAKGKRYYHASFQLFGTPKMVEQLKSIINNTLDINITCGINKAEGKNDVHYVGTNAKDKIKKIADWLYRDSPVYAEHRDIREIVKKI